MLDLFTQISSLPLGNVPEVCLTVSLSVCMHVWGVLVTKSVMPNKHFKTVSASMKAFKDKFLLQKITYCFLYFKVCMYFICLQTFHNFSRKCVSQDLIIYYLKSNLAQFVLLNSRLQSSKSSWCCYQTRKCGKVVIIFLDSFFFFLLVHIFLCSF